MKNKNNTKDSDNPQIRIAVDPCVSMMDTSQGKGTTETIFTFKAEVSPEDYYLKLSYYWEFGGLGEVISGSPSDPIVQYRYTNPGQYRVSLGASCINEAIIAAIADVEVRYSDVEKNRLFKNTPGR